MILESPDVVGEVRDCGVETVDAAGELSHEGLGVDEGYLKSFDGEGCLFNVLAVAVDPGSNRDVGATNTAGDDDELDDDGET